MKTCTAVSVWLISMACAIPALADPQQNDPTIGNLPGKTQSLRLYDYTETVANLMIQNTLSYKAFVETFHIQPRVDMVFVTKVRDDVTRFRIVGKDYDGPALKGCVEWRISYHQPKPDSPFLESSASRISKTDCSIYQDWEKFIDLRK